MNITPKLLTINYSPGRAGHRIRAIVLHVAAGTEAGVVSWFQNPASGVSAHYLVTKSGAVLRFVPEADTAWGNGVLNAPDMTHPLVKQWANTPNDPTWPAGLPNLETISIEREGQPGELVPTPQWEALVQLVASIYQRHGLAPDRSAILGHSQLDSVTRPNCPGFDAATWSRLVGSVAALVAPPTNDDTRMEAAYQADAARLGTQLFAGQLTRDYYTGPVLVCERGVITPTGQTISGNIVDDWVGLNETAGTLTRY